jgi:hypothetical protein
MTKSNYWGIQLKNQIHNSNNFAYIQAKGVMCIIRALHSTSNVYKVANHETTDCKIEYAAWTNQVISVERIMHAIQQLRLKFNDY